MLKIIMFSDLGREVAACLGINHIISIVAQLLNNNNNNSNKKRSTRNHDNKSLIRASNLNEILIRLKKSIHQDY